MWRRDEHVGNRDEQPTTTTPFLGRLGRHSARLLAALVLFQSLGAMPVAAQTQMHATARLTNVFLQSGNPLNEFGDTICGTGLGTVFALVLSAIAMYLLAIASIRGMMAFNKLGSSRSEKQFEGKQQIIGAGKTGLGAFVPVLFAGLLEAVGIRTISCLNFDLGIFGTVLPLVL